ncbi:MAG TPA: M56 family metallopeptidase [Sphingomicrobium sp.]|nr:M56 family metallopeptidase [Sphingomicrobium sp.]
MMDVLIGIALKSLLIAGLTLGLLQFLKNRSAAERSWVAHIGLLALLIMALAPVVMPRWSIATPAFWGSATVANLAPVTAPTVSKTSVVPLPSSAPAVAHSALPSLSGGAALSALYAVPAAILLFITLLALLRLVALRARAEVLVDGHWLSALARAQRRMGFKHGTALLTSNELASPISWGLVRPVILLNSRAVEASREAEAIIAHELAHVARMDWMKLLLARFATALFWFNPLVWMLAREAHQLREEAADDSVLAADIVDTDYAELLVGVARHECPGLLLGAHGVAPSKSSLSRRVARVLDGKSVRGPVARSFALGVFAGAVIIAAPLAALTLTPEGSRLAKPAKSSVPAAGPSTAYYADVQEEPTDLPRIIAKGVTTSITTATAAIAPRVEVSRNNFVATASDGASLRTRNGMTLATAQNGATVTLYPPDANGRRRMVARNGSTALSYADADGSADASEAVADARAHRSHDSSIDMAIGMKAAGLTPEYVAQMRAASPALRNATINDMMGLKAVGATPEYVREIASAGYGNIGAEQLEGARAIGLDPAYVRAIASTGVHATIDELIELRAMGVRPDEFARVREVVSREHPTGPPRPPQPPSTDRDDN